MKDVLVFGTGRFYEHRKAFLYRYFDAAKVVGFLDNHRTGKFEGKQVWEPTEELARRSENILLMSASAEEMREQLLALGVAAGRIFSWEVFFSRIQTGCLRIFPGKGGQGNGKRILFIHIGLFYNGATIAAMNACLALKMRGYDISLAVPDYDAELLQHTCELGIQVIHFPTLPGIFEAERCWLKVFDVVIVNVYQMIAAACEIAKFRPVLWWIHEADDVHSHLYSQTRERYPKYVEEQKFEGMRILAVSAIGKRAFEEFHPHRISGILPYGISDDGWKKEDHPHRRIGIAILGAIFPQKAQDVFMDAIKKLPDDLRKSCRFYIIGGLCGTEEYNQKIERMADEIPDVEMTGWMTRSRLQSFYPDIDVVVSASLVDTLPIVVTEGLMNRKICIVTDEIGQAQDIICDGVNGFVCKAGDASSLAEKMAYVIEHFDALGAVREKARAVYEKYFSMESFGKRLEQELLLTEQDFWRD